MDDGHQQSAAIGSQSIIIMKYILFTFIIIYSVNRIAAVSANVV